MVKATRGRPIGSRGVKRSTIPRAAKTRTVGRLGSGNRTAASVATRGSSVGKTTGKATSVAKRGTIPVRRRAAPARRR